jgi:hypothetical protein
MCCTPGRCPCWPRPEPFCDSERHVLFIARAMTFFGSNTKLFGALQRACADVKPRRLPYVLSTFVRCSSGEGSTTLLYVLMANQGMVKWLLHAGVCPNLGMYYGNAAAFQGWAGGHFHPGRPPRRQLCRISENYAFSCHAGSAFLAHGTYPGRRYHRVMHENDRRQLLAFLGRWHRWHARASRRLWICGSIAEVEQPSQLERPGAPEKQCAAFPRET